MAYIYQLHVSADQQIMLNNKCMFFTLDLLESETLCKETGYHMLRRLSKKELACTQESDQLPSEVDD